MFFGNMLVQTLIIVGFIALFLASFLLNKRTKMPDNVELPEKCTSCVSSSCIVKLSTVDELKKQLREELDKVSEHCEE